MIWDFDFYKECAKKNKNKIVTYFVAFFKKIKDYFC